MDLTAKKITKVSIVAAIYVIITFILSSISYGPIQFRISEILILLAFINKDYIIGLTLGCLTSNLLGPYGLADIIFGTLATFISAYLVYITPKFIKNRYALFIASLWPVIINSVIIGIMLNVLSNVPLVLCMIQIAIGEFVVVSVMGVILFKILISKYKNFLI